MHVEHDPLFKSHRSLLRAAGWWSRQADILSSAQVSTELGGGQAQMEAPGWAQQGGCRPACIVSALGCPRLWAYFITGSNLAQQRSQEFGIPVDNNMPLSKIIFYHKTRGHGSIRERDTSSTTSIVALQDFRQGSLHCPAFWGF